MRSLDARHWQSGGTGITNFDPADEPIYCKAIEIWADASLVISDEPMAGPHLEGSKSLHWLRVREAHGSLSPFWRVFDDVLKMPEMAGCPLARMHKEMRDFIESRSAQHKVSE